jgi:phage gpG-like protein
MSTVKVAGGGKLDAALARYLDGATKTMRAGILEGSTYPDGTPTALVGFWNEYGATIQHPGGTKYIDDAVVNGRYVGTRFVGNDFSGEHKTTKAHEINIPARPFMRTTAQNKAARWAKIVGVTLQRNGGDFEAALKLAGEAAMTDIKQTIATFNDPPNAASTIRKKGHDQPLRDTKNLMHSIAYDVVDGEVPE